jgi:hypothetical protein
MWGALFDEKKCLSFTAVRISSTEWSRGNACFPRKNNFVDFQDKTFLITQKRWFNALLTFFLVCEAIGTAATPGLLCQPRMIVKMIVEKQMECRLAGEIEVLGENLPQRHFCPSQNPT